MATGVIIQNSDGSTQQVPFEKLQQFDPLLYKQYIEGQAQPAAGLQQTQTSTAATGAQIPGIQAKSNLDQIALARQQSLQHITSTFKSAADKNGYVDPTTYNAQRKLAGALGVDGDAFDTNFSSFVNPTGQIKYNTKAGQGLQQKKATILQNIDAVNQLLGDYQKLGAKGPIEGAVALNPATNYLGAIGLPTGGAEKNYEARKQQIAASLQDTLNKSDFTGLGIDKADLNSIISNIPSVTDPTDKASDKIQHLNDTLGGITGQKTKSDTTSHGGNLLTGLLGDILNPGIDAVNKTTQDTATAVNNPKNKGNLLQSILSAGQATGSLAKNVANTAPSDALLSSGPLLGKILGPIAGMASKSPIPGDIVKSLVSLGTKGGKKGAVSAMEEAVGKGVDINWDRIASQARESVVNKGTKVQQQLEQLLKDEMPTPKTPEGIANPTVSSPQALELRKGLGARLPSNFYEGSLGKIFGGKNVVPRNTAVGALRDAVSSALKEAAPDIKNPDKLYSFYARTKGDVPAWGKRIAASYLIDKANKNLPQPVQQLTEVLPELIPFLR